jgi:putative DNA primase/helicase
MTESLRDRLAGRWVEVLARLGVPAKFLTNRNCGCPLCGGRDRFRFTPANGLYICNKCGGGDGIDLVMRVNKWDFKTAAERIEPLINGVKVFKPRLMSDFDKRRALNELWRSARLVTPETPAGKYLTRRTGITEYPACLRAVDSLRYWDDEKGEARFFPAMIAMVVGFDGRPVNIHRTYLSLAGDKAQVDQPRRLMPGRLPRGCVVRLGEPTDTLGVGEGLESCISAGVLHRVSVWSLLSTSGMEGWEPPIEVSRVIVFGDNDKSLGGQAAAYALGYRLKSLPKRKLQVEVRIPGHDTVQRDWNDVYIDSISNRT